MVREHHVSGEFTFFLFSHGQFTSTHTAVHHVRSLGCHLTKYSRYIWKPRPLWLSRELKGMILIFLLLFDLFSKVLTLLLNTVSWLKQLMQSYIFRGSSICSTEHQELAKWKLSLQWFHSWIILHHPRWQTKLVIFSKKKTGILSLTAMLHLALRSRALCM